MTAPAPPFWFSALVVLTVGVGSTGAAREHGDTNIAENLFIAFSNACRTIMKTYASDRSLYGETKKLSVLLYGPSGLETYPIDEAAERINRTGAFALRDEAVITIHGFNDRAESAIPAAIAEAYREKGKYNVMLLDCSALTSGQYVRAAYMSQLIGRRLALFLTQITDLGAKNIHLIGLSLGAQTAGWAGRFFRRETGGMIRRITGLDPAGPCFTYADSTESLNEDDALFVDVIHVNRGVQGILEDVGHADFFVNGGGPNQPGCPGPNCSHSRAGLLFVESLQGRVPFMARKCDSWDNFLKSGCDYNEMNYMGYNSSASNTGKFFIRTASEEPFSLGLVGAKPKRNFPFNIFNFG